MAPRFWARSILPGLSAAIFIAAQTPELATLGPGVQAPKVIHKVQPQFTPYARAEHVQGTVILEVVITARGRASEIQVISPLGYGLDEKAEQAIQKWEFAPAIKDGQPVALRATIEVNFRFQGTWFDERYEHRRSSFNLALQMLARDNEAAKQRSIKTMLELSKQSFPGAMYLTGMWQVKGENLPRDERSGWTLIQKAAEKHYGPALYQVAYRGMKDSPGGESAGDAKSWDQMRQAATLGSMQAQFFLGDRYQRGEGVTAAQDRARHYFRLCAARGQSECQYRLARLMFDAPVRPEYEYEQALAWFGLAADQGVGEARRVVERERPRLTPAQQKAIGTLKRQFVGKFE